MPPLPEIRLEHWNDIHRYDRRIWLYRGHRSSNWPLKSSLERLFERRAVASHQRQALEAELIRDFRRAYHQYATHIPARDASVLEWLSLMQHHGAPTRLCDFTYSIYVAAYFALEATDEDCAVWAINGRWAMKQSIQKLKEVGKGDADTFGAKRENEDEPYGFASLFLEPTASCAVPVNPFRLNERLRIQKGVFIAPGELTVGFMENLQALPDWESEQNLLKIVIPASMRREAIERLFYMNISRTSLFPGLDGFAQTLGVFHPSMNLENWHEN